MPTLHPPTFNYQRTVADKPMMRPFRMPDGWLNVFGCRTLATTGGGVYCVERCRITGFALSALKISSVGATLNMPMPIVFAILRSSWFKRSVYSPAALYGIKRTDKLLDRSVPFVVPAITR